MTDQLALLKEIITLKKEHPDFDVKFCVNVENMDDNCAWMEQKIDRVEICEWYLDDDRVYIDDDIVTYAEDMFYETGMSDEDLEKLVASFMKENAATAICVFTF